MISLHLTPSVMVIMSLFVSQLNFLYPILNFVKNHLILWCEFFLTSSLRKVLDTNVICSSVELLKESSTFCSSCFKPSFTKPSTYLLGISLYVPFFLHRFLFPYWPLTFFSLRPIFRVRLNSFETFRLRVFVVLPYYNWLVRSLN